MHTCMYLYIFKFTMDQDTQRHTKRAKTHKGTLKHIKTHKDLQLRWNQTCTDEHMHS